MTNKEITATEGGWGYVVALGMAVMFIVSIGPLAAFGIIYEDFLTSLGDKADGNQMINSIFNTFVCLMGVISNQLFKKFSFRFTGLLGASIFFLGTFSTIFIQSIVHLSITFGVLQGVGFGLMVCTVYSTFNDHFSVRKNVIYSISHSIVAIIIIVIPRICHHLMNHYGYRGTLAIISALSLHNFPAMLTMLPNVRNKMKTFKNEFPLNKQKLSENFQKYEIILSQDSYNVKCDLDVFEKEKTMYLDTRKSLPIVESLLEKELENNKKSLCQIIYKYFELSLLRDPRYVNIAFGLALCLTSDMMFLPLIPKSLNEMKYDKAEVANLLMYYLTADCCARILYAIINIFIILKNRHLYLYGAIFTAILRLVFTFRTTPSWTVPTCLILLGLLRCIIQVLLPLVLMDYSRSRFTAALSLFQLISAIISLTVWPLTQIITELTTEVKVWALHLLTIFLLLCAVPWSLEMLILYWKKINHKNLNCCYTKT